MSSHRRMAQIYMSALNRVLWHSIKGADVPFLAPVRRVLATRFGVLTFPKGDE